MFVGYPIALFIAIAAPVAAQDRVPPAEPDEIVVTGIRLEVSAAALRDCIARRCPPDQDIAATLAHAENLFVAGDYKEARKTSLGGIKRNKRYSRTYPVEVAGLLRANSRIGAHLGEGDSFRIGALDVVSALKSGLPHDDPRVLSARLEVGDSFARSGRIDGALNIYRDVASRAHDLNLPAVEGFARLRTAILYRTLAAANPAIFRGEARRAIAALVDSPDPRLASFALAAKLVGAQMAAGEGDSAAIDRIVAEYRKAAGGTAIPVLLYSPGINQRDVPNAALRGGSVLNRIPMQNVDDQWVDVSFWITPDGKVTDAGVLRRSAGLSGDWVNPIIVAVAGRRYAPLVTGPNELGLFRVERFTYTARWENGTGTHLRVREPTPHIETLDLSRDPPAKAPGLR